MTFEHLTIEQLTRELPPIRVRPEPLSEMDPSPLPPGVVRRQAVKGMAGTCEESSRTRRALLEEWVSNWRRAHPDRVAASVQYGDWPERQTTAVFLFSE